MSEVSAIGVIQARMSSSRLPGKVLRVHGGRSMLERVVRRTQEFTDQAVVCTSMDRSDDAIAEHCETLGVICARGPLNDVFARYRMALDWPGVEKTAWFFRITADCPLLCSELGHSLLAARTSELDYLHFSDGDLPRGLAPELIRRQAFDSVDATALDQAEREHVTVCFYREGSRFRRLCLDVPLELRHPELRLTLDYPEDERLLQALWEVDPDMSAEAAVRHLLRHPEIAHGNQRFVETLPPRAEALI